VRSIPTFSTLAGVRITALQLPAKELGPLSGTFSHFLASKAVTVQPWDKLD